MKKSTLTLIRSALFAITLLGIGTGCAKTSSGSGTSYSFSAAASAALRLTSRKAQEKFAPFLAHLGIQFPEAKDNRVTGPTLCGSVVCFTPTKLTGKYYGTGFLIQSSGNGMVAYFGQDNWSDVTSSSTLHNFDSSAPITNSDNLTCCGGTGDLDSTNTYISDVIYLFGYLDATFAVTGVTSNTNMNTTFTVRFILADGAVTNGVRGDLMLKDPGDSTFKWMDTATSDGGDVGAGHLTTTRPTAPVTMNTSVVNWSNPFGTDQGSQTIPVIYAGALPESGSGVLTTSKTSLETTGKTYTFAFNPANFVMFPALLTADINSISTYRQMLNYIHLGGLPHSLQTNGVGNPASTVVTITGR